MTKRIVSVLLALLTAVGASGCSVEEWLDEQIAYGYTVQFDFSDNADREKLKRRLEALDFEIVSADSDGKCRLEASYVFPDDYFDFVCAEHNTTFTDEFGNVLLTSSDISAIECDDISLDAKVSKETAERLEEVFMSTGVLIDDSHETFEAEAYCYDKDDEYYVCITMVGSDFDFDTLNEAETALFACAITLTGEKFGGDIKSKLIERTEN